jgi:hypothetical protein
VVLVGSLGAHLPGSQEGGVESSGDSGARGRVDGGWPCGDENAVALGVRAQGGGHGVWRGGGGMCSGQGAGVVTSWLVWKEHGMEVLELDNVTCDAVATQADLTMMWWP